MARATAAGEGQEGSRSVARRGLQYAGELGKLAVGRSEVEPSKRDRRFKDPAWSGNPAFRRLEQGYLATGQAADRLIGDSELDWKEERRVRFAVETSSTRWAPTNFPLANPAVMKAALDSGGATSSAAWATSPATFVVDLAPERSLVEYLVGAGQQVFTISWRNPDERHAD